MDTAETTAPKLATIKHNEDTDDKQKKQMTEKTTNDKKDNSTKISKYKTKLGTDKGQKKR